MTVKFLSQKDLLEYLRREKALENIFFSILQIVTHFEKDVSTNTRI